MQHTNPYQQKITLARTKLQQRKSKNLPEQDLIQVKVAVQKLSTKKTVDVETLNALEQFFLQLNLVKVGQLQKHQAKFVKNLKRDILNLLVTHSKKMDPNQKKALEFKEYTTDLAENLEAWRATLREYQSKISPSQTIRELNLYLRQAQDQIIHLNLQLLDLKGLKKKQPQIEPLKTCIKLLRDIKKVVTHIIESQHRNIEALFQPLLHEINGQTFNSKIIHRSVTNIMEWAQTDFKTTPEPIKTGDFCKFPLTDLYDGLASTDLSNVKPKKTQLELQRLFQFLESNKQRFYIKR